MHDTATILAMLGDTTSFPNIPRALVKHVEFCFRKGHQNRLTQMLRDQSPEVAERVAKNIDQMLSQAAKATHLTPDELLRRTDFVFRDPDPVRLDAAFAEIRAVIFLDNEGFADIQLLKAGQQKRADIVAKRKGCKYAIEVAHSIYDAPGRWSIEGLRDWLLGRYRGENKAAQLEATAGEHGCHRHVFIGVVNNPSPFLVHEEYCRAAGLVWNEAGRDPQLHFCFVTGQWAEGYGLDDCGFPDWPK